MYDVTQLKKAIQFNNVETLPGDDAQLTAEVTKLVELANKSGEEIRHYIGFEISGLIHLGTGLASALKIKKLTDAGVRCSIYLANYHAWLNHKLDGKMETIEKAAREYFAPVMAECFKLLEVDMSKVDFVFASDLIKTTPRGMSYFDWELIVSQKLTLNRIMKSMSIMGKEAGEGVEFASLRYPAMQCTDAFFMGTHLVHAGLDQRKVHVLMREVAMSVDDSVALKIGGEKIKPIAIHHSLLLGLSKPEAGSNTAKMDASVSTTSLRSNQMDELQGKNEETAETYKSYGEKGSDAFDTVDRHSGEVSNKMSKSKPDSAIWVHDSEDEIKRKLKAAYCPMPRADQSPEEIAAEQSWNPLLNWAEKLLYPAGLSLSVTRPEQHGGNKSYSIYSELYSDYISGSLHPMDLKTAFGTVLSNWLSPLRIWAEGHEQEIKFITDARK
jgi:tyrosyl-tRNA synthetase